LPWTAVSACKLKPWAVARRCAGLCGNASGSGFWRARSWRPSKQLIESGPPEQVLKAPAHDSTHALLAAWLSADAGQ
jgi:hypothetical protein